MLFSSWLRNGKRAAAAARRRTQTSPRRRAGFRPRLEVLEDRAVPSGFQQTNLVSYQPGLGHFTDPNLNGWGMTSLPDGSFVVANAFSTGQATFYDRSGHVLPQTITVPQTTNPTALASAGLVFTPAGTGHPTGVVYNPTSDFVITNPDTGTSAPATLIFDTLDGVLCGWNPAVDSKPIVIRDTWATAHPAVYTGLEIGQDSQGHNVLYAADFLNNDVEMIGEGKDGSFTTIKTISGTGLGVSSDPYSWVWSVQAVNDKLYVTFADLLNPAGGGGGAVDVFDSDGNFQYQLDANGPGPGGRLQNPWGITQAPANFGAYSNDLLVGNVAGAGNINVYNPTTGQYLGQLRQPNGAPIAIKGLWDLEFGDGVPDSGKTNQLFFDAGPNHPNDGTGGLLGVIRAAGDQSGNGGGGPEREAAVPSQPVRQAVTRPQPEPVVQQALADWQSNALPLGVLGQGSGAVPGGVQAPPVTPPSPALAAGAPSASAAGSSQAVPLVSTPAGPALGVSAYRARDQVFADLDGARSVALAPTADSPWTW
jgi:uncharacterized protein (TIGR03118 family)